MVTEMEQVKSTITIIGDKLLVDRILSTIDDTSHHRLYGEVKVTHTYEYLR